MARLAGSETRQEHVGEIGLPPIFRTALFGNKSGVQMTKEMLLLIPTADLSVHIARIPAIVMVAGTARVSAAL